MKSPADKSGELGGKGTCALFAPLCINLWVCKKCTGDYMTHCVSHLNVSLSGNLKDTLFFLMERDRNVPFEIHMFL